MKNVWIITLIDRDGAGKIKGVYNSTKYFVDKQEAIDFAPEFVKIIIVEKNLGLKMTPWDTQVSELGPFKPEAKKSSSYKCKICRKTELEVAGSQCKEDGCIRNREQS